MSKLNKEFYNPSFINRILKTAIINLGKMLPVSVYVQLYDFSFGFYRVLLRLAYSRHLVGGYLTRNSEKIEKTKLILKVMPYSLVGSSGLEATYDVTFNVERTKISGNIVECGVAQGGTAGLMSSLSEKLNGYRDVWLFDSYEGLPEPTEVDYIDGKTGLHVRELPPGSCLGRKEQVEDFLFNQLELRSERIYLVKGWFEDTLKLNTDQVGQIALLRIDADWYESVKCCLNNLYDNVAINGYVIIDDYGSCFGAKKATDEFLAERKLEPELVPDGRGGCYFQKLQ